MIKITFTKKPRWKLWLVVVSIVAVVALVLVILVSSSGSPIPKSIAQQANFRTVYPSDGKIVQGGSNGYQYQSQQKAIVFKVNYQGATISVTEQTAPANLASGTGVYFSALGLHPVAQFDSKLGPVAILNFYKNKTLEPAGQSGLLVASKTMVIANPLDAKTRLSNEQWKNFFDSLKQAK